MANVKISDLTEITSPGDTDWLEMETSGGLPRKVKKSNLGAARSPMGALGTMPALSGFTQVKDGTNSNLTFTENSGKAISIFDTAPSGGVELAVLAKAVPVSTPYRVAICIALNSLQRNYTGYVFGWRATGGTMHVLGNVGTGIAWEAQTWASATSRTSNSSPSTGGVTPKGPGVIWLGLRDDGTSVHWGLSADGCNFAEIYHSLKSANLGTGNWNQIVCGLFTEGTHGTDYPVGVTIFDWDEAGLTRLPG